MNMVMSISVHTSIACRKGEWKVIVVEEYSSHNDQNYPSRKLTSYVDANNRDHAESISNRIMNESKVQQNYSLAA